MFLSILIDHAGKQTIKQKRYWHRILKKKNNNIGLMDIGEMYEEYSSLSSLYKAMTKNVHILRFKHRNDVNKWPKNYILWS